MQSARRLGNVVDVTAATAQQPNILFARDWLSDQGL
jgi:hypothetical protein